MLPNQKPCTDTCYKNPVRWKKYLSRKYHDRYAVRCMICGKLVGYEMKDEYVRVPQKKVNQVPKTKRKLSRKRVRQIAREATPGFAEIEED